MNSPFLNTPKDKEHIPESNQFVRQFEVTESLLQTSTVNLTSVQEPLILNTPDDVRRNCTNKK